MGTKREAEQVLVLRFFRTQSGRLRCRITEAESRETWISPDAKALRALVAKRVRPPARRSRAMV